MSYKLKEIEIKCRIEDQAATDEAGMLSLYDIASLKADGLHEGSENAIKVIKSINVGDLFE